MDPDRYKRLQSNLNKEETRLKSLTANMDPVRLVELESINETLQYGHNQFQIEASSTKDSSGGLKLLEKTKPVIKIYSFEDIDLTESISFLTLKRQIPDKLQVNLVGFNDRIEIRCHIPIEPERSTNVILTLGL
jgi:hypothetical protein